MKFLFTESFGISEWNGKNARTTKGISGSHTAAMYLAEALVLQNQQVDFVSMRNQIEPIQYKGVNYFNVKDFMAGEYDFLITTHNLNDLQILSKATIQQKIILILHNELYNDDPHSPNTFAPLLSIDIPRIILAFISKTSQRLISQTQSFLFQYSSIYLPNSLDVEELIPFRPEEKQNQFVFFANRDRGFELAHQIVQSFPEFQMVTNTYGNEIGYKSDPHQQIIHSHSSSKQAVYQALSNAKYFVYPLMNMSDNVYTNHYVHYDTFGYVILEALCHGVVVLAPKMAVYKELFGDAICYVDSDGLIEPDYFQEWRKHNRNFGAPLIPQYISKIRELESNPELRQIYIQRGLQYRCHYAHQNIANQLMRKLDERKQNDLRYHLRMLSIESQIPQEHIQYLYSLKAKGFEPKVIYDIGACVGAWTKMAKQIWPDARYVLFEANGEMEFIYWEVGWEYSMGLLGAEDGQIVKYYQNDFQPTGNSYYREIGCEHGDYHPENQYLWKPIRKLDMVVEQREFPLPDMVKIDVQGAEWDIFLGARNTFSKVQHLIMELQHTEYNQGALKNTEILPKMEEFGWECVAPLFCNNGPDGDYDFIPSTP
jgi:FkbM family methyltransferase